MSSSHSLATKLSRRTLLITMIVFLAALLSVAVLSVAAIKQEATKSLRRALDNTILDIEKVLVDVEASTETMAWSVTDRKNSEKDLRLICEEVIKADDCIISCAIAFEPYAYSDKDYYHMVMSDKSADGTVTTRALGDADYDYHTFDWYLIPKLLGKEYWCDPSLDTDASGAMVASYSKPLYDTTGTFIGIIKSDISLEWLTDKIANLKPYDNAYTLLIGRNGSYISHYDKDKILNETIFSTALNDMSEEMIRLSTEMIEGKSGFVKYKFSPRRLSYAAYGPMQNGWSALMVCPFNTVYKSAKAINFNLFAIALIGLLVLYFGSKKVISRTMQPMTEITYAATNMAKGFFNAKLPEVDSEDEIKELQRSMDYLQHAINRYIRELKSTKASKEKYENDLSIASTIQQSMLPKNFPTDSKVDLYAALHPAREVGGDLYDFIIKDHFLYFAVGDVSGKGIPASLYMALTRSALRLISGSGVCGALKKINDVFSDGNDTQMFVTLFVGKLDLDTLELTYCNGGHNPIIIVSPDGKAEYLHAKPNIAAGLFAGFEYQEEKMQLSAGTRLVLYTDGVSEAENHSKDQYGEDRLLSYAQSAGTLASSQEFAEGLLSSVREFTDGNAQNDDITVLTFKI